MELLTWIKSSSINESLNTPYVMKVRYYIKFLLLFLFVHTACSQKEEIATIDSTVIQTAEKLIGIEFTAEERALMLPDVQSNLDAYQSLRQSPIDNSIPMALDFNPIPPQLTFNKTQYPVVLDLPETVVLPENKEAIAFYSVAELSVLIRTQQITSTELTKLYLNRLKKYGNTLECVISITEEMALAQARKADEEIANGKYRGPLHGIPYGVKDLIAVKGTKTTWGAMPYKEQVIDETATIVEKLEAAGAVLVAKLTLGALAWGDVWYDGVTKNPWNLEQGSSGSSAGSAAATVAGLVGFSIGTETLGSIVSPSTRCGASGLRPTYGRVSRHGAMALSWSMDKIGPICRTAEDCALVFQAIIGTDSKDQSLIDLPFNYNATTPLSDLRIGYLKDYFESDYEGKSNDSASLEVLKSLGANLIPVQLPSDLAVEGFNTILTVEAAAAFDELTRSNLDSTMVRQIRWAWPNKFRQARLIPAVEYIQANRQRYILIQKMHEIMKNFDVIVTPSYGGSQLLFTNLTGHPCVVVPNDYQTKGQRPSSISFIGNLYDEGKLLTIARAYQKATGFEDVHPAKFK